MTVRSQDIIQEHGQQLLSEPEYYPKLLAMLPDVPGLREDVEAAWGPRGGCIDAMARWEKLQGILAKYLKKQSLSNEQRLDLVLCPQVSCSGVQPASEPHPDAPTEPTEARPADSNPACKRTPHANCDSAVRAVNLLALLLLLATPAALSAARTAGDDFHVHLPAT